MATEFRQNLPIYPDPLSKDQGMINRQLIAVIQQLWRKSTDSVEELRKEIKTLNDKIDNLQNQINRLP